jgi:hypothetical protein
MTWLRRVSSLFRNLVLSNRVERELDEEVRSYLALLIDEKIAAGMSPEEAHRAARIECLLRSCSPSDEGRSDGRAKIRVRG